MTETMPPAAEFLLYQTQDGRTSVECRFVEVLLFRRVGCDIGNSRVKSA